MSDWNSYKGIDSLPVGTYYWRVPHSRLDVVVCGKSEVRMRGHGYEDPVASPEFDYWDGYRVHLPKGLQFRELREDDPGFMVEDLSLSACPFCGVVPEMTALCNYIGYDLHKVSIFTIEHCFAKVKGSDPRVVAKMWNTRAVTKEGGA